MEEIDIAEARTALGLTPEPAMRAEHPVTAGGFRFTIGQRRAMAKMRNRVRKGQEGAGRFAPEIKAKIKQGQPTRTRIYPTRKELAEQTGVDYPDSTFDSRNDPLGITDPRDPNYGPVNTVALRNGIDRAMQDRSYLTGKRRLPEDLLKDLALFREGYTRGTYYLGGTSRDRILALGDDIIERLERVSGPDSIGDELAKTIHRLLGRDPDAIDNSDVTIDRGNLQRAAAKKTAAKKTAAKKTTAKKTAAKKTAAVAGTTVGAFKDITTLERARKAAEAETSKIRTQHRDATKAMETAEERLKQALANPAAEPSVKTAARKAAKLIAERQAVAQKALDDAEQSLSKANATTDLGTAIGHARDASSRIAEATTAAREAKAALADITLAANANERPKFENAQASKDWDSPPAGYRRATPEEARSVMGNSPLYAGMLIADDPEFFRPYILIKPNGEKKNLYIPAYHLEAERKKWERVEYFRPAAAMIRQSLEKIARGGGVTGTPLQQQRQKDNAFSLLLTLATGMRPSSASAGSTVGGKKIKTYGSSNLERRHVERINRRADGSITSVMLKFPGKSGAENRIKVTDPFLMEEIARRVDATRGNEVRREKNPVTGRMRNVTIPERERQIAPISNGTFMVKMLREAADGSLRALGMADEIDVNNFGTLDDGDGEGGDPMAEALGKFSVRTLRTMFANAVAAQVFSSLVKRGGAPTTPERFAAYMEEATKKASEVLGNQHPTFKKNYLSALPFLQWMPQGMKQDGTPQWEDWWKWGKKNVTRPE